MKKATQISDFGLSRFKEINKYSEKFITEQAPPPPPAEDPDAVPPPPGQDPAGAVPPPPPGEEPTDGADEAIPEADPSADDTTEEIDITDLVNMTKSIKKQLETTQNQDGGATQKMDDIFTKLNDLESKIGEMDNVLAKIDQLGAEIKEVKPKTPIEKLEMRSLDSYPFNKKPDEFFQEKQNEMKKTGKNEYVLTKGDVENYGKYDVMKSFNPGASENQVR